jgi:hypothetical protein
VKLRRYEGIVENGRRVATVGLYLLKRWKGVGGAAGAHLPRTSPQAAWRRKALLVAATFNGAACGAGDLLKETRRNSIGRRLEGLSRAATAVLIE